MKTKISKLLWNALVDAIPILLPLIVQHKDKIIKGAKKVRIN
jgi:adenylyl- and sulfurtransferase ThiI